MTTYWENLNGRTLYMLIPFTPGGNTYKTKNMYHGTTASIKKYLPDFCNRHCIHGGCVYACMYAHISLYCLIHFFGVYKTYVILSFPTWINVMDIPQYNIYEQMGYLYDSHSELLCLSQEGQRLHWQFHVDIPKGKKHWGHSDIITLHVLFLALIFGLNESEKWLFYSTEKFALILKSNQLTELGEEFVVPYMNELKSTFRIIFPLILFLISMA